MMKVGHACPDFPEELYKKFEQWWIMQSSAVVPKIQPTALPQSVRDMFYRNGSSPRQSNVQDGPANCIVPKTDPKTHSLQVISFVKYIAFAVLNVYIVAAQLLYDDAYNDVVETLYVYVRVCFSVCFSKPVPRAKNTYANQLRYGTRTSEAASLVRGKSSSE